MSSVKWYTYIWHYYVGGSWVQKTIAGICMGVLHIYHKYKKILCSVCYKESLNRKRRILVFVLSS